MANEVARRTSYIRVTADVGQWTNAPTVYRFQWNRCDAAGETRNCVPIAITIVPTRALPRNAALVLFVRARKPRDNLLAGVSTRRLVQVTVRG
jgi:hypothetical protein